MRTTVTLDPDTELLLRSAVRQRGVPFKQALNDAIRAGLQPQNTQKRSRFRQATFCLGTAQDFRLEKALAMADALEDEELIRKMALRK